LQTFPSAQDVPAATGVCVTPLTGSQASAVQGLLSSRLGMVPGMHVPEALQVPAPVQMFPSVQVVPAATGVWVMPDAGLQLSAVQGFWSSTATGEPGWQLPVWQVSLAVQALLSLQAVPLGAAGLEQVPLAGLHVPTM